MYFYLKRYFSAKKTPAMKSKILFSKEAIQVQCGKVLKKNLITGRIWSSEKLFIIQNYTGTANADVRKCLISSISFEIKMQKHSFGVKNHTHVKKVAHNPEFLFGIYWLTWKTTSYLKNCWSGLIKNVKIFIFTLLLFFLKKNKEKHLEMLFTHVHQKSWWWFTLLETDWNW